MWLIIASEKRRWNIAFGVACDLRFVSGVVVLFARNVSISGVLVILTHPWLFTSLRSSWSLDWLMCGNRECNCIKTAIFKFLLVCFFFFFLFLLVDYLLCFFLSFICFVECVQLQVQHLFGERAWLRLIWHLDCCCVVVRNVFLLGVRRRNPRG